MLMQIAKNLRLGEARLVLAVFLLRLPYHADYPVALSPPQFLSVTARELVDPVESMRASR